jgi:sec-independent protein translocase protein TatB
MFDIGWGELMLIGIVALIAIGPKELPGALRTLGQWIAKVRHMAAEFQGQFQEAMREAELAELRKEVDEMAAKAAEYTHFDPVADVRNELEKAADLPDLDAPVSRGPAPPPVETAASLPPSASAESAESTISEAPVSEAEPASAADVPVSKPDAGKAA